MFLLYRRALLAAFIAPLTFLLFVPGLALADVSGPPTHLVLPTDQIWAFVAGNLAPLVAYVLNYHAPWISESFKVLIQAVAAAVAGGIVQAITAGGVGFNATTLQFVVTAVVGAFLAHAWVWSRSPIATNLGGGRNKQGSGTPGRGAR